MAARDTGDGAAPGRAGNASGAVERVPPHGTAVPGFTWTDHRRLAVRRSQEWSSDSRFSWYLCLRDDRAPPHDEAWFWATHQGAEIDLLLRRGDRLFGVECKRADTPRLTPSIHIALEDLGLERVAVVYPGSKRYPLGEQVEVVPLTTLAEPGRLFG